MAGLACKVDCAVKFMVKFMVKFVAAFDQAVMGHTIEFSLCIW